MSTTADDMVVHLVNSRCDVVSILSTSILGILREVCITTAAEDTYSKSFTWLSCGSRKDCLKQPEILSNKTTGAHDTHPRGDFVAERTVLKYPERII